MALLAGLMVCINILSPCPFQGDSLQTIEERIIESRAQLIINGQEISSPFKVVLDEEGITVNGIEFTLIMPAYLEIKQGPIEDMKKPSIEDKSYPDWLIRMSVHKAKGMLSEQYAYEEICDSIEVFLEENSDGTTVEVTGKGGSYRVKRFDMLLSVGFTLPRELRTYDRQTKKDMINFYFNGLCHDLSKNRKV